jgi:hypothetical protein
MGSWSQWVPLRGADAAQRLLGPLNMAGKGDGKGGDGGEGTVIYVCVCCFETSSLSTVPPRSVPHRALDTHPTASMTVPSARSAEPPPRAPPLPAVSSPS